MMRKRTDACMLILVAALLSPLVRAGALGSDLLAALHVRDAERYENCPLHNLTARLFACFKVSETKSEMIFRHTSARDIAQFVDARKVFSLPALRNSVVMMVGDSMMRNQFTSLGCLLWEADPTAFTIKPEVMYSPRFDVKLMWVGSNLLLDPPSQVQTNPAEAVLDKHIMHMWDTHVRKSPDKQVIMMLSTGHHYARGKYDAACQLPACNRYAPDMNLLRVIVDRVNHLLRELRADHGRNRLRVLWRGVPARHFRPGTEWDKNGSCLASAPCVEDAKARMHEVNSNYWVASEASQVIEESAKAHGFPFVDISPSTMTRCDGNVGNLPIGRHGATADCSHYCVPGVPDTWNRAFVQAIVTASRRRG